MQQDNWVKVHTTAFASEASVIEDLLAAQEIMAVILNKKDSSYNNFGNCEIFVTPTEAKAAREIINEYFSIQ